MFRQGTHLGTSQVYPSNYEMVSESQRQGSLTNLMKNSIIKTKTAGPAPKDDIPTSSQSFISSYRPILNPTVFYDNINFGFADGRCSNLISESKQNLSNQASQVLRQGNNLKYVPSDKNINLQINVENTNFISSENFMPASVTSTSRLK